MRTLHSALLILIALAGCNSRTPASIVLPAAPTPVALPIAPIAPADVAGDYLLTIQANETCNALPPEARTRAYAASIVPVRTQPTSANTHFQAELSETSLVRGLSWDGLWIAVVGNTLELSIGDFHGQPGLLERIDADTYFSIGGVGYTSVATSPVTTISSIFDGEIVYCVFHPGTVVLDANRRYTCGLDRAVTRAACHSPRHRLTLTRR